MEVSCKWINDSQRFLLENFDVIQNSPSHIYHSALPLCPASSWLHESYSAELSQEVKVVKGLPSGWGTCISTVSFGSMTMVHTSWKDLIAVGLESNIITIDAVTGAQLSVLSGHTGDVTSLTFSSDGTLLVSGDEGGAIKLWDIQTGVVVRTLDGHIWEVCSVSISPDHTMIASGSEDGAIRLWDTWTGECCCVIDEHNDTLTSISFSPTNSQHLISASKDNTVRWWDVNGHQIGPTYKGDRVVISSDGSSFAPWTLGEPVVTVHNSGSGTVVAELQLPSPYCRCCQFSPDSKSVACGVDNIIYIWDITNPAPHLVGTFIGHSRAVTSITFSSSLISLSWDGSVKLWQFGSSSMDSAATGSEPASLPSGPIKSVKLQTNDGIALSFDSAGVVRSWDIMTGLCKAPFHTPAKDIRFGDMQVVDSQLILVWHVDKHLYIWDSEKEGSSLVVDAPWKPGQMRPIISGDGSKVFILGDDSIQGWSAQTGEHVGQVQLEGSKGIHSYYSHSGDGSRIWVNFEDSQTQGWDFGISDPSPIPLPDVTQDDPHLKLNRQENANRYGITNKGTGNEVFRLSGKYANPTAIKWDGQYVVAGYESGEVLILDFNHMLPQQR